MILATGLDESPFVWTMRWLVGTQATAPSREHATGVTSFSMPTITINHQPFSLAHGYFYPQAGLAFLSHRSPAWKPSPFRYRLQYDAGY